MNTPGNGNVPEVRRESFDVRLWAIRSYKGKRKQTHPVRWTVAGQEHHDTFGSLPLAKNRLAELRRYAWAGTPFDVETGLPVPELREAQGGRRGDRESADSSGHLA